MSADQGRRDSRFRAENIHVVSGDGPRGLTRRPMSHIATTASRSPSAAPFGRRRRIRIGGDALRLLGVFLLRAARQHLEGGDHDLRLPVALGTLEVPSPTTMKHTDNSTLYAPPPTLGPQRIGRDSPKSAALSTELRARICAQTERITRPALCHSAPAPPNRLDRRRWERKLVDTKWGLPFESSLRIGTWTATSWMA